MRQGILASHRVRGERVSDRFSADSAKEVTAGFSIATEAGVTYQVYYKNSLADADWTLLTTISGDGTVKPVTDPGPLPPTRFYTVRPQPRAAGASFLNNRPGLVPGLPF